MGMDVYGLAPKNEEGEYFRANIWSWAPLQALMVTAGCKEALNWGSNDGLGFKTQEECDMLATQVEQLLKTWIAKEFTLEAPEGLTVNEEGRFNSGGTLSPYKIDRDHVEEWITFLRSCGGFEIC